MAVLRICLTHTQKEWDAIAEKIKEIKKGPSDKVSISGYISSQLRKKYHGIKSVDCPQEKAQNIRKDFMIEITDDLLEKIQCDARTNGVMPGTLISRQILFPLISQSPEKPM